MKTSVCRAAQANLRQTENVDGQTANMPQLSPGATLDAITISGLHQQCHVRRGEIERGDGAGVEALARLRADGAFIRRHLPFERQHQQRTRIGRKGRCFGPARYPVKPKVWSVY